MALIPYVRNPWVELTLENQLTKRRCPRVYTAAVGKGKNWKEKRRRQMPMENCLWEYCEQNFLQLCGGLGVVANQQSCWPFNFSIVVVQISLRCIGMKIRIFSLLFFEKIVTYVFIFRDIECLIIVIFFYIYIYGLYYILQYFYKMLMWPTSYWFLSRLTINITFSFTNNHLQYQQFVNFFVK